MISTGARAAAVVAVLLGSLIAPSSQSAAQDPPAEDLARPCDPIDPSKCLFPFPNDFFTVADGTATGRRVAISPLATPRNVAGKPIDPTEFNRNDGFSPGAMMLTHVPGLDLSRTSHPPIADIAASLDRATQMAVINAATGERHPFWAELDANATSDADRTLILRPAVNLEEGTRYVVALGKMRDENGDRIPPSPAFRAYRDRRAAPGDPRTAHMEDIFRVAATAGLHRKHLFLAWDFTVASEQNLTERLLHIRDDAFENYLGDTSPAVRESNGSPGGRAPSYTVDHVQQEVSERIARKVTGTFTVPSYLTVGGACTTPPSDEVPVDCTGGPGSRFNYVGSSTAEGEPCTAVDTGCLPSRLGSVAELTANYTCIVPRTAVGSGGPARASLYGHGLLGGAGEVLAGNVQAMAQEHNFVFCATDWIGMATEDVPNVATILADVSNFPTLADRAQQGMLNFLFLGRLMIHPDGFVSDPVFEADGGRPLIDTSDLFYDGNSQGGIMGGALTAVAQDFRRAVLGVPAMNYSTLLNRSVDFEGVYSVPLYANYPDKMDQQLIFALIQMLWDRAEANGYAHHMTDDPPAKTPSHEVLLHVAFGDHQVANVASEVEARTIGASVYQPALIAGRHWEPTPFFGIPPIGGFPQHGSALVYWDNCHALDPSTCDTPSPPTTNTPPRGGEDPHGKPRAQPSARLQKATFLRTNGFVIDVCGGQPCLSP